MRDVPADPIRCGGLLETGRDVGVDDDVSHWRSGQRGVAGGSEIDEEGLELLRTPDVLDEVFGRLDDLGTLKTRELLDVD